MSVEDQRKLRNNIIHIVVRVSEQGLVWDIMSELEGRVHPKFGGSISHFSLNTLGRCFNVFFS